MENSINDPSQSQDQHHQNESERSLINLRHRTDRYNLQTIGISTEGLRVSTNQNELHPNNQNDEVINQSPFNNFQTRLVNNRDQLSGSLSKISMEYQSFIDQKQLNRHSFEPSLVNSQILDINRQNGLQELHTRNNSTKFTDLFLDFARQHENQRSSKNAHSISPFSNKCNNEYNRYLDLAAQKDKYLRKSSQMRTKMYTPIANRTTNQIAYTSLLQTQNNYQRHLAYYQEQENINSSKNNLKNQQENQQEILIDQTIQESIELNTKKENFNNFIRKLEKTLKQNIKREFMHRFLKINKIYLALDLLNFYRKKFIKHEALRKFKLNPKQRLNQTLAVYEIQRIFQKDQVKKISRSFNQWKYQSIVEDLQEQIELQQNDLIIERSKLISTVTFSKLNTKIETQLKFKSYLMIKKFSQALRQLEKIQRKFNLNYSFKKIKINSQIVSGIQKFKRTIKAKQTIIRLQAWMRLIRCLRMEEKQVQISQLSSTQLQIDSKKPDQRGLIGQIIMQKIHFIPSKESNYFGIRQIQRLVHSQPNLKYQLPTKQQYIKKKSERNNLIIKQRSHQSKKNTINIEFEESEENFNFNQYNQTHFVSALYGPIDESIIKNSPRKALNNKSKTYNQLNISNILKNNGGTSIQDTIIDEEDHAVLSRLIQKYQRDFTNLQHNSINTLHRVKASNYSQSTLNLNSHETNAHSSVQVGVSMPYINIQQQQQQPSRQQNSHHKKLHSMLSLDRNPNFFTEVQQIKQSLGSQQHELWQQIIQGHFQSNHIQRSNMIDEEQYNEDQDKLSFISPTSQRFNSRPFSDQRVGPDNSISVSKIEEQEEEENNVTGMSQSRIDIQELKNQCEGDGYDSKRQSKNIEGKKDFSFSLEKEKQMLKREKDKNKKKGNSRNLYGINRSKQEREDQALNELTNVLNQQYQLIANQNNLRSSDLVAGGTYGGQPSQQYMNYNPQLEQETANFNIGDWHLNRSPMGSTHQNLHQQRPLTRSSLMRKSQSSNHQRSQSSQRLLFNQQQFSPEQESFIQQCKRKLMMISSPEEIKQIIESNQQSANNQYQYIGNSNSVTPLDTVSKLNFNYMMMEQDGNECQSPVQIQSHFANFSQDFISPERENRTINNTNIMTGLGTTLRKEGLNNNNNSVLLNTSGAQTFAQQSAFEQFRSRLHENLRKLNPLSNQNSNQNLLFDVNSNQKLTNAHQIPRSIKPQSQNISPYKFHLQSRNSEYDNNNLNTNTNLTTHGKRGYQSNEASIRKFHSNIQEVIINTMDLSPDMEGVQQQIHVHVNNYPINERRHQRESQSNMMDMADPIEIGSQQNSIQNFNKWSFYQPPQASSVNQRISIQDLGENQTIDEQDMTLRKSPEPQSTKNQSKDSTQNIPILHFDLNIQDDKLKFDNLRQSVAKNQEFLLQTQQSLGLDNHFTKRTMSHNDLVQLGTMSGNLNILQANQNQINYLNQRSQSIQQLDQLPVNAHNSKYIDAFKQYEAEKVKRRRSEAQQWKMNNLSSTNDNEQIKSYDSQTQQMIKMQQQYQNFFNQYQTIQSKRELYSPLKQAKNYIIEEQEIIQNGLGGGILSVIYDEDKSLLNNGIQEREAEEEESFIAVDLNMNKNTKTIREFKSNGTSNSTLRNLGTGTTHLTGDANTISTIPNQNTLSGIDDETKTFENVQDKSSSLTRRQPKEIVIQLDISSYATHRSNKKNKKLDRDQSNDKTANDLNKSSLNRTQQQKSRKQSKINMQSQTSKSPYNSVKARPTNKTTKTTPTTLRNKLQPLKNSTFDNSINQSKITTPSNATQQMLLINELLKQQMEKTNRNNNINQQKFNTTSSSQMKENLIRKKSQGNPLGETKKSDLYQQKNITSRRSKN